jgi:hypothetical protein
LYSWYGVSSVLKRRRLLTEGRYFGSLPRPSASSSRSRLLLLGWLARHRISRSSSGVLRGGERERGREGERERGREGERERGREGERERGREGERERGR